MKDKAFARAVSRDDCGAGAEEIGLPLDQHIAQRDRVHAGTGGRAGTARNALMPRLVSAISQDLDTVPAHQPRANRTVTAATDAPVVSSTT